MEEQTGPSRPKAGVTRPCPVGGLPALAFPILGTLDQDPEGQQQKRVLCAANVTK